MISLRQYCQQKVRRAQGDSPKQLKDRIVSKKYFVGFRGSHPEVDREMAKGH